MTQILGSAPDPGWCERAETRYRELLGNTSHWRAPDGAADVLAELERRGVRLALLTGVLEGIARLRMDRLGLATKARARSDARRRTAST